MRVRLESTLVALSLTFASSPLAAQIGTTVPNWTVPPYHAPAGGITAMTDFTPPRAFVAVTPCRVVDTRSAAGPYGGPPLATNAVRTFDINNGPCPGIPEGVDAYSLNFGGILPPADGFLTAWPTGIAQPVVSQLNLVGGEVVANAAIVPAGPAGVINVLVNIGPTHVYIDINGYFADALGNPANSLWLDNHAPGGATAVFRNFALSSNSWGLRGIQGDAFPIPTYVGAGVRGESKTNGVLGVSQQIGVAGSLLNGAGAETAFGLLGYGAAGPPFGVYGWTGATSLLSAGVKGVGGAGVIVNGIPSNFRGGVWGESHIGSGVVGITDTGNGVVGAVLNNTGLVVSFGILGCSPTEGLCASANSAVTGMSLVVEPHPTDASKTIRYVSLEGNEAGTYFRGRGRFENGLAVIEVPSDFRIVTDPEGLSIQVTPIGETASVAVQEIGLDRIVVKGTRDVEFFFLVNGVRHAYRDAGPIAENALFVPASPDEPLPAYLPEALRQRLISNGTYRADGTVNLDTAQRLGWDKIWEQRSRPVAQPTEP
jgi:hypothetical protein